MTGFLPASSQARAHSIFGHPCSKFGNWPLRRPKTLSPAGNHSITTGTEAELGSSGLGRLPRGSTAGSGAASPRRAESRKPLSPHLQRQRRGLTLQVPGAPRRVARVSAQTGQGKWTPLRVPEAPSVFSRAPTPHTAGKHRAAPAGRAAECAALRPPHSSGEPLPARLAFPRPALPNCLPTPPNAKLTRCTAVKIGAPLLTSPSAPARKASREQGAEVRERQGRVALPPGRWRGLGRF